MNEDILEIIDTLDTFGEESSVPKSVKAKIIKVKDILRTGTDDVSIKINRVLHELEEITDDSNIQPYTRTELLNIVSMLESALTRL